PADGPLGCRSCRLSAAHRATPLPLQRPVAPHPRLGRSAMSGICGWVGDADPSILDAMLAAIAYRGDRTDTAIAPGVALGYRWWADRPGKSPAIHRQGPHLVTCAGTLAPPVASPAAALLERLAGDRAAPL